MVKRGEVWWYHHPERKPRPVCVLTRDEAIPVLARVVVVEATTTARGVNSEVVLDREDGMPKPCVLSFDNVSAVRKPFLTERITTLKAERMHEVCEALAFATGC